MSRRSAPVLLASPLLFFLLLAGPAWSQRLPRDVLPVRYDLTFEPDFETDTFGGDAAIEVEVQTPVREVVLHGVELVIEEAWIDVDGRRVDVATAFDAGPETLTLAADETLPVGPATLRIRYRGILNDDLRGFYLGTFRGGELDGRKYAATQMEPTDARRAFPGFDEPGWKTPFDVTLVVDAGHAAISNGPIISAEALPGGKKRVRFATTPRMPTYLLALVVGDFRCLEGRWRDVPLGVCAATDKAGDGRFALDATVEQLDLFAEYLGTGYPFAKLDQIGIADFSAGAMENLGAIIYREAALLVDPATASFDHRRRVGGIVAHELAHMWFGDLVTTRWWDDIWLNEGLATFMTDEILSRWRPEWDVATERVADAGRPMDVDVLRSTRPIRQRAETPAEIDELFDGIAYRKTASLVAMIEGFMGEDALRRGLGEYLRARAWDDVVEADFVDALASVTELPVEDVLRSYVAGTGVPAVEVRSRCEGDSTVVELRQRRLLLDGGPEEGTPGRWTIPVCFGDGECVVLQDHEGMAQLDGCRDPLWANDGGRGYYVVDYGAEAVPRLLELDLEPGERLVLLRDAWYGVQAGSLGVGPHLTLLQGLAREENGEVWRELLSQVHEIALVLPGGPLEERFATWVRALLAPAVAELGMEARPGESDRTAQRRADTLEILGRHGHDPVVLSWAAKTARAYLDDPASVAPELAGVAVEVAALRGEEGLWTRYRDTFFGATNPMVARRMLAGLTAFEDPVLVRRTYELALDDRLRAQDLRRLVGGLALQPVNTEPGMAFLDAHWDVLLERAAPPDHGGILPSVARRICDSEGRARAEAFAAEHPVEWGARKLTQTLESIDRCIRVRGLVTSDLARRLAD